MGRKLQNMRVLRQFRLSGRVWHVVCTYSYRSMDIFPRDSGRMCSLALGCGRGLLPPVVLLGIPEWREPRSFLHEGRFWENDVERVFDRARLGLFC